MSGDVSGSSIKSYYELEYPKPRSDRPKFRTGEVNKVNTETGLMK